MLLHHLIIHMLLKHAFLPIAIDEYNVVISASLFETGLAAEAIGSMMLMYS